MKKVFAGLFVLVLGMALANVPQIVKADTSSTLAPGEWQVPAPVIGTVVSVTAVGAPSYLQLITNGIKITAPAKICHAFSGAGFNWVGEVRQLVDKSWVKVKTTTALVPSTGEGVYTACAKVNHAGTYALFAYYHVAIAEVVPGNEEIAEVSGMWNRGTEVSMDFAKSPAPAWLDNYSNWVKVKSSGTICHPFPAGVKGLVAEIRELKTGKWVKLPTTFNNAATAESTNLACALAPEAGTYTLFGYVTK
jgi:hypothetical protein